MFPILPGGTHSRAHDDDDGEAVSMIIRMTMIMTMMVSYLLGAK